MKNLQVIEKQHIHKNIIKTILFEVYNNLQ